MNAAEPTRPWYRHFWVWFVIAPPAATVLFWTVILTTAAGPPSLVVDDYSKIGLIYQREHARDAAAAKLGLHGRIHVTREEGRVMVALTGLDAEPQRLELTLAHPTDSAADLHASLHRDDAGLYRGALGGPANGRRYIELHPGDGTWRLAGEMAANRSDLSLDPPEQLAAR